MDFTTGAWFSLLAAIFSFGNVFLFPDIGDKEEYIVEKYKKYISKGKLSNRKWKEYCAELSPIYRKFRINHIFGWVGLFCCLVMVLQGIHLWSSYEGIISPVLNKMTVRFAARRGGLIFVAIQLIFRFLPQFIIVGYGGLIYLNRHYFSYPRYFRTKWMEKYR